MDENERLSAVMKPVDLEDANDFDLYFVSYYEKYKDVIAKEFGVYANISQYDIYSIEKIFSPKYSVDNDNNIYQNNHILTVDYSTGDVAIFIYDFLIKHRDCLEKNKTKVKKLK